MLILKYLGLHDTVATEYVLGTQLSGRPSASSSLPLFDYGERITAVLTAIKYGNPTAEDTFQAEVCLAWLHWTIDEPELALSRLPIDLAHTQNRLMQTEKTVSGWTHICIVKGGYLQGESRYYNNLVTFLNRDLLGICQENTGDLSGAAGTYNSMLSYILKEETLSSRLAEHRVWIQRLLARYCLILHRHVESQTRNPQELLKSSSPIAFTLVLTIFRAWAGFWETSSHHPPNVTRFSSDKGDVSQRLVWQAYFDTLSLLIHLRSIFPSSVEGDQISKQQSAQYDGKFFSGSKSQFCIELKQVQSIYENFLVDELGFPKANEATPEIENWVDQAADNWKIICGPTWQNEDHTGGGKEATSRLVLEVREFLLGTEMRYGA